MDNNPRLRKYKVVSMRRKFILFSVFLFLIIFFISSISFIFLMGMVLNEDSGYELAQTLEIERLKLENIVNGEIALVLQMADSPLLKKYFEDPGNLELEKMAFDEIEAYHKSFVSKWVFWVNDKDKKFFFNGEFDFLLDPDDPLNEWYNTALNHTEKFIFNVNYNPEVYESNIWINAPVFNDSGKPVAVVGMGMEITPFLNSIYHDYYGRADLYFFNSDGEITCSRNPEIVLNKKKIYDELGKNGVDILASALHLNGMEIKSYNIDNWKGAAAVARVPALDWYATAIMTFSVRDVLRTQMTTLYIIIMLVLATIFVIFNLFIMGLLGPLNKMVSTISQLSADWDGTGKNEIETIGAFFLMAIHDPLTGLFNRRYLDGNLKKMIRSLSRKKGLLSLLMLDIDFFKKYNDTYGHSMGDDCLKKIANVLQDNVTREDDFVARYGGEEFVIVMPNTDEEGLKIIAQKLLDKIQQRNIPHESNTIAPCVTVSIGGTSGVVEHTQTGMDFIKQADKALYLSKEGGRNRYTFCALKE